MNQLKNAWVIGQVVLQIIWFLWDYLGDEPGTNKWPPTIHHDKHLVISSQRINLGNGPGEDFF